ncbi:peptidoglycan DD-metalloendopeptidase family protein [Stutzerimonas tarimensis]|uniref:Peptidoglycan DD-metalloendopeptidase family protein n=1 Tax=Stutzerimonas tarimensis TaxID=1507735 RepID=A0ABV7T3P2_9GAMM
MTHSPKKAPLYPKSHLLAASGVAALLSLALLVFPSREVEAKRASINLDFESSAQSFAPLRHEPEAPLHSAPDVDTETGTPFALIEPGEPTDTPDPADFIAIEGTEDAEPGSDVEVIDRPLVQQVTVASGDTLSTIFSKAGIPSATLHQVLANQEAKQFTRLRVGQMLEFEFDDAGDLLRLSTQLSDLVTAQVERTEDGFVYAKDEIKPEVASAYAHGMIDSSLFLAAKRAGLGHSLTMDLANIFGYDIDFAQDIRKGDAFELIYETKTIDGRQVGTGKILAARFTNRGKTYSAIRYTDKQGNTNYYTADGDSTRKAFIRTPVDFARISSRFSTGRKHPILNKIRAHKGVDYAAPHGTPIKATGDGKVVLAGRNGGYGNTVIIQHGKRYRTLYAHMQGFAKGVRNGSAVKQGQIIGYIGTTGLSTGPHLHYEFQVDGQHVDPLSQKLPTADPIPKSEMQRFAQFTQPLLARMESERATQLALNEE